MKTRRIIPQDVAVGKLRREFSCMKVDNRDEIMYVGTKSGDIVKVYLNCPNDINSIEREKNPVLLSVGARWNPKKNYGKDCEKFENGVRDLIILLRNPVKFRNTTLYDFFLRETSTGLK
jgi:hypothetical protein